MKDARTIDMLVAELRPVRRVRSLDGYLAVAGACAAAIACTALFMGLRSDMSMQPALIVIMRSGLLLLLGAATTAAVVASARPSIGTRREGWRWALGAALLLPVASAILSLREGIVPEDFLYLDSGSVCLAVSLAGALIVGAALMVWLRQGAVTKTRRAGWLVGLAAGAFGTFAYNLYCPSSTVHYAAIWYSLAVLVSAIAGRVAAPRLLRW
jgi:hypothetical protein